MPAKDPEKAREHGRRYREKKREERRQMQERTRRIGKLAYLIWREWWRPFRNRQRRREIARLMNEDRGVL
jgi:hypothetical protein